MFSRAIIKRSVIVRSCNIRFCRTLRKLPSTKVRENIKDSEKSVDVPGTDCDDYLGVNLSILEHVEDKVNSEEIQNEVTKEDLSRMYGLGEYTKPYAYDSQVLETNFGSITVDGVRKGLIPSKKDFSKLKPTLGSIADTLVNYRKKVDEKISPHSVSQLLLNQLKGHDDDNDSSMNKTTQLENQDDLDQHKNKTELQSETTNSLQTIKECYKSSTPVKEITVEGKETGSFKIHVHQGSSSFTQNKSDQLLTQADGVQEEIICEADSDTLSTISKSTYRKPVFDKLHQVHNQRIVQMNATDTVKEIKNTRTSVGTEALSLNSVHMKERNTESASKQIKSLFKEDTTLSETNLPCGTLKSEKVNLNSTIEQKVKNRPLKHPLDSFLESSESRVDQAVSITLEKETSDSQEMQNSFPERVASMSDLDSYPEIPMVENAAYKYFQELQRQDEVPKIDRKSTANLSKYLPKKVDKLTDEEVVEELVESIIYNRDDILAINKLYGIPSQGGEGVRLNIADLLPRLAERIHCKELHMVHRLDKETTGIMLFGKTEEMANKLRRAFKNREVKKTYLVITKGVPSIKEGIIDVPITEGEVGKNKRKRMTCIPVYDSETKHVMHKTKKKLIPAITHYKVVANSNSCALLEVSPETGVKHQIRTHLFHVLNTPLLGDHKYSYLTEIKPQILPSDIVRRLDIRQSKARNLPMYIHAKFIMIPEFLDGRSFSVHCSVPRAFRSFLKRAKISHKNVDERV